MKRTLITLTIVNVALLLAIVISAPRTPSFTSTVAIAAPAPAPAMVPVPARCPNIHEAIGRLEEAERELREARHDFCGHKRDAMEITHRAIEQLRQAEGCDRCR